MSAQAAVTASTKAVASAGASVASATSSRVYARAKAIAPGWLGSASVLRKSGSGMASV